MELVVDANVLISAFIRDSHTRHLLLFHGHDLSMPEYALREIEHHLPEILEKVGLSKDEGAALLSEIVSASRIRIIPERIFIHSFPEAMQISPDPDDVQYFALALHRGCYIWSNDKALCSQKKVKILTTEEVTRLVR